MTTIKDIEPTNELLELCREVYEKTGWVNFAEFDVSDGHYGYTSDYLLEKLQKVLPEGEYVGVSADNTAKGGWFASISNAHSIDADHEADTPLKALLKLTLALSKAGEIKSMTTPQPKPVNEDKELSIKLQELTANTDMTDRQFIQLLEFVLALLDEREKKHIDIYRWLLGYTNFRSRNDGEGAYYWRTELIKKLPKRILAQLSQSKEGK